ncbi:hypothetical protein [Rhizobium leguminosarum]|uniref:hypothetical protein n=1 Tax=Rhizobium leguminosarum TaxID=384 RepID=UPI001C91E988|nr:hypothetical protein [Rhizobium leguminosarum]MBY3043697.1 hypothetical protein [Rhizobium leguminosarum]
MIMTVPFNHMTAAQIRGRLTEIASAEQAYTARDFDAELGEVMRKGGDLDAMEAKQLEVERAARRLRVERSALEAGLPLAIKREAELSMSDMVKRHQALGADVARMVDDVHTAWGTFHRALKAWELAQQQAAELTESAYDLSRQAGVKMADLGTFQSSKLCEVAREAQFVSNRFGAAEHQMQVGHSVHGRRLD